MNISILVVDDERPSHEILERILLGWRTEGLRLVHAFDPNSALAALERETFQIALVDLHYSKGAPEGFSLLLRMKELDPAMELIVVSSMDQFESVQSAMRAGASDYVAKGYGRAELVHAVERALERRRWRGIERRVSHSSGHFVMVGQSKALQRLQTDLVKVAPKEIPVLLEGETGSGKEVAARALHFWGRDPAGPFVAVNCAAVPASTADSYFFGHEKGAFTGADRAKEGVFEEADGGTLFLDEVNSLPLDLQGKLLRVLQEREVRRLGGQKIHRVDFRLVAASNQSLAKLVKQGAFREDLWYRLNVVTVRVPALRERVEDLEGLAAVFVPGRVLDPGVMDVFRQYTWPGNVREFRNVLQAMDALADPGEMLSLRHLPERVMGKLVENSVGEGVEEAEGLVAFTQSQEEREREYLAKAYRSCGGNVSKLSRLLGVDRSHLHHKLSHMGIHRAKQR